MPAKAPRPCPKHGCNKLVKSGYCAEHTKKRSQTRLYDKQRGSAAKRGYDRRWRKFTSYYLAHNPTCQLNSYCDGAPAVLVDHVIPLAQGGAHCSIANSQASCQACHNAKTAKENKKQ